MKFCSFCDNFLYIKLDDNNNLTYHCKNCNHSVPNTDTGSICITDNNYVDDDTTYNQYVNKYIKYDPTLPRVSNIKCPNKDCSKPSNKENEVIYIKYDQANMKYIYHCVYCDKFWRAGKDE